ncbi:MAG: hypothetical protein HYV34_04615 [Candidatus Kerfeldbacteria bacterium]|nr:hypothetical protein [Candidatus Kerfeldbacteria bacterium]
MRLPVSLSDAYGAAFPTYTEIDHALALRGYLCLRKKEIRDAGTMQELDVAIDEVTNYLAWQLGVDLSAKPLAPRELFQHYLLTVSKTWRWLARFS